MTNLFEHILVPYNGCPGSQKAFKKAVGLSQLTKSKLTILTCVEDRATFGLFKTKTDREEFDKEHKMIELEHKKLEKYAAEHDIFPVFKITKSSVPSNEILEFANKHDVDLIIMGLKKRTRYEKRHYPSTIEDVSKNFERAILILN